jgi:alkylation response protein AidB-like acyl-CoA dehydrogenase
MTPLAAGLVHMELHRGDGSLGTFLGVQSGLAMKSIAMLGSTEQKERWLPAMARLEKIGAFALTEPEHGSDSVAMETTARREGDEWVIDGAKRSIGNATIADVIVVWARDEADQQVKGFLVTGDTPGYTAAVITSAAQAIVARVREVIAHARDLLGGNGILLENHVIRHMTDIEVLHTYEGTETMQTLIVGRDITGIGAFA